VSVTGKRGVGIPVILLHDAEGGMVTVELKNGCVYRGLLDEAQDNMNLTLKVTKISACTCVLPLFYALFLVSYFVCRIA
jgi:hypothetical protein